MTELRYAELLPTLTERSRRALLASLASSDAVLRTHLGKVFARDYGTPDALLADPAFEAVFGWTSAQPSMAALAGNLLSDALVAAMDAPPPASAGDYRFARQRHPYEHQLRAWEILSRPEPASLVVASGTGSGKTECFMVPILDRLARARDASRERLTGVRALLLYPLNALINSQRERLRAWTAAFGDDLRFCLYNGNTPESVKEHERRAHPNEVLDRDTLRAAPPPLLITNATMLEYLLVRTADAPILRQSQGLLEWVVLDEAHTYVGSQAAEAALLLRRVLFAFGVRPDQVRFVATSATIGDPEGEAGQQLRRFLADVAGVDIARVHLVAGTRAVPALPGTTGTPTPLATLAQIDPGQTHSRTRYAALAADPVARRIRDLFVARADRPAVAQLSAVAQALSPGSAHPPAAGAMQTALQWLDLLSGTCDGNGDGRGSDGDGAPFLPLRAHLFHQSLAGLWACADPCCPETAGSALAQPDWRFGQVYLQPRTHCTCGGPVYELVSCDDCGTSLLLGCDVDDHLKPVASASFIDEFELVDDHSDADQGEDEGENEDDTTAATDPDNPSAARNAPRILIVNRDTPDTDALPIDRATRAMWPQGSNALTLNVRESIDDTLACPCCGHTANRQRPLLRHARVGAPFLMGTVLPTLLEAAPDGGNPAALTFRGRRLLSFNDSRQGSARMAAHLQQDSERNLIRGLVYHLALPEGGKHDEATAQEIKAKIAALAAHASTDATGMFRTMLAEQEKALANLTRPQPVPFAKMAERLADQGRDFDDVLTHYERVAPQVFSENRGRFSLAQMLLVREFGRRPKRANNLETMGMVAVCYPALEQETTVPPAVVQAWGCSPATWRALLKIALDFFVRAGGSLTVDRDWLNWLGMRWRITYLVPRDRPQISREQRRWPRARRSGQQSTLVRLLSQAMNADLSTPQGEDRVDTVLQALWDALLHRNLLTLDGSGYRLRREEIAFQPIEQAWVCPVTQRFLDVTLDGITPYLPRSPIATRAANAQAEPVTLPRYDTRFGGVTDSLERIARGRAWLAAQAALEPLRARGLWSNLNDRVIELSPYYRAAEHSAQLDAATLTRYEDDFKAGKLNILSCSTTMEMGIDIGGIAVVAMNNVPPHPANYLQRAGRAGRRGETRSLALTLCKANPHDQAVFDHSRWAFDAQLPAPRVSLDSRVIVIRHVRSLLLGCFLAETLTTTDAAPLKLTCAAFFLGDVPLAARFADWCRALAEPAPQRVLDGVRQLTRNSHLDGTAPATLGQEAAATLETLAECWRREWQQLDREHAALIQLKKDSPVSRAVAYQRTRMEDAYLLSELSSMGFLPAYGFPLHIAPLDHTNIAHFKQTQRARQRNAGHEREDNRLRFREMPSRDLATALREYAPGADVVIDGLVYRSAGVTLNWHIPMSNAEAREVQEIRWAWRCEHCGASGSAPQAATAQQCSACGEDIAPAHRHEFLEPAGFAVDFYAEPHNDTRHRSFVPVEPAWVNAQGDWTPLPEARPSVASSTLISGVRGRYRSTPDGHVFHQTHGPEGRGFALCLECGRAEPMAPDDTVPASMTPHRKLRRSRDDDPVCPGSHNTWKIKAGLVLGHDTHTDVFELQLRDTHGGWLSDPVVARTLAVALRAALAAQLGVQSVELGCDIKPARAEDGRPCQSIIIFDRHAAGYASGAGPHLDALFALARERLTCPAPCDSACPRCILDFDQRFAASQLNRHAALKVLGGE